jgi:magnesium transporter
MIDNAVYAAGRRIATPDSAAESHEWLEEGFDDRMVWLGLYRPEPAELGELAEQYGLPELAVEDAIQAHQRPKFERYGDTLFVVLKAARYLDAREEVEFGELHLFLGKDFAITVRHSESPDLSRVRRRLESSPELLSRGSEAVLYAILDAVVDGYAPVVAGLENDIDEIEVEVFRGTRRCPGASTSCPRRSWTSSGPPSRSAGSSPRSPRGSRSTGWTRSCAATCVTSPTTSRRSSSGWRGSGCSCATS